MRWWRSFGRSVRDVSDVSPAFKLRRCTFTSLRMVLRRWWSRDLFGCHYSKTFEDIRPIDFRMRATQRIHSHSLQKLNHGGRARIPAFCKHRYIRIRNAVLFKCTLMSSLSVIHRWWDHHLLPHPADRPHLFVGKHTERIQFAERQARDFDARGGKLATLPAGWFYCEECKHRFLLKFMGERSARCLMCEEDFCFDY